MENFRITERALDALCRKHGLLVIDIETYPHGNPSRPLRVFDVVFEDPEGWGDSWDQLCVVRHPVWAGWHIQTVGEELTRRLPPPGVCGEGDWWWVDTGPSCEELGEGLGRLARALWDPLPVPLI